MSENRGYLPLPRGFSTDAIRAHHDPESGNLLVVPPIVTSATFKQKSIKGPGKYEYGRLLNPNRDTLENCLAKLENAKYGLCFASGLGAITSVLSTFKTGDHLLLANHIYGGTSSVFSYMCGQFGFEYGRFDISASFEELIKPNTKLVWIESPTNPVLKVVDIQAVAKVTKKFGILLVVDNTFLTPYYQRPLGLGADISVYSITKYLNGHSDVIMGSIATNDEELYKKLKHVQTRMGIIPSPFDCAQVLRSLKTLEIRLQKHSSNAISVAKYLENHPKIEKVVHPGLPSHPMHDLAKRQTSGHSGIFGFYIKNVTEEDCQIFIDSLMIFSLVTSLGGYESTMVFPYYSHAHLSQQERDELEVYDNYVRISIGLEDPDDLIKDLEQALDKI